MEQKKADFTLRAMQIEDYDEVYTLWKHTKGFAMRSIDDSKEKIARFLERNPHTSVVALIDGAIVGSILCGHDGRQGCFYHVCVSEAYRRHGIGKAMAQFATAALLKEQISKVSFVAFSNNEAGNAFWRSFGVVDRSDLNRYDLILNKNNIVHMNE
jgi:ribosomal protein S18 acetylase RimI-like enzyme